MRDVCSAAHAVRKANGRRARLPLRRLTVATARPERLAPFVDLIDDEVNVKEVVLTDEVGGVADEVLTLVHAALGPRLGPRHPARHRGGARRGLAAAPTTASWPAGVRPRAGRVRARAATPQRRRGPHPARRRWASSPSTPPSTTTSSPRAGPATWSGSSRLSGATPACTSRTASTWPSWPRPTRRPAVEAHRAYVAAPDPGRRHPRHRGRRGVDRGDQDALP